MDHTQVAESHLVEQYLLEELPPELRDEFEEHFFDCLECAAELRMTGAFLDAARSELQAPELALLLANQTPIELEKPRAKVIQWPVAFALAALAACLLVAVLVYQSFVTVPHLRGELAALDTPEVLPTLSLAAGASRGGALPSITRNGAQAVLLQFDIPTPLPEQSPDQSQDQPSSEPITQAPSPAQSQPSPQAPFLSYTCSFYSPALELLWTVQLPAQAAHDTVNLRVPLRSKVGGTYILEVKGHQNSGPNDTGVTVANYRFSLNADTSGAGH